MAHKAYYGVLAEFSSAGAVYEASKKIRQRGFQQWDVFSPLPIHGLEKAAGFPPSPLGWIVAVAALVFGCGGFVLWSWMNAVDYKYVIAGKPFYSWPAYFLPGFECAVLSGAIACLVGLLALNKLPRWYHPLFKMPLFKKASDDGFFIVIESADPRFHPVKTVEMLEECGAIRCEWVEQ